MPNLPGKIPPYGPLQRLIDFCNDLRDCVESLYPRQSVDTLTTHTALGVSRQGNPAATAAPASNWFRGEYNFITAYVVGNGVKISGGVAAGLYICTVNVTMHPGTFNGPPQADASTYPWLGNNWSFIGQILDQSNWI